jgi:hypothetical protein
MQACRDRQGQGRNHANRPLGRALAFGFQHRLRHFFHEQRNAVGALNDVLPDARRQQLVADDPLDHRIDIALHQPIDGEGAYLRPSDPRRLELRPERHDQHHTKGRDPVHRPTERFQARGGRSNARPRRSSAPDWSVLAPLFVN